LPNVIQITQLNVWRRQAPFSLEPLSCHRQLVIPVMQHTLQVVHLFL